MTIGLTHGYVYRSNILFVAAVDLELEEQDVYHGYVMRWQDGVWGHWKVANRIYGFGVYDLVGGRTVLAMGPDGRIHVGDSRGFRWESVDSGPDGPSQRRPLTCLR